MSNWIKCSDELPELGDYSVLVCFSEDGTVIMAHVEDYFADMTAGVDSDGKQLYTKWYLHKGVTHWVPLPEPPKE